MPPRRPDIDDDLRSLYQGPLADFTAHRQALVKQLRQAGDDRAAEIAKLRKPSLSAWAVNQLFGREARGMAALVGAGERARAGQPRAGNVKALREALEAIGAESRRLGARGVELLTEAGGAPGEGIVERVRTNLEALALDPANAAVAERRWLDDDLERPGFEVMAGLQIAAAGGGGLQAKEGKEKKRPGSEATVHRFEDGRKAAAERKDRERRERLEHLKGELERLEAKATEAAQEAERASKAVAAAEQRVDEARAAAKEAKQKAANAEEAKQRAREAVAAAERLEK